MAVPPPAIPQHVLSGPNLCIPQCPQPCSLAAPVLFSSPIADTLFVHLDTHSFSH